MTEPTPDQAAVTTAQALTKALEGMSGELAAVNKRQDRMRHVVIGLTVSLVLDVLLTVVVAAFAVTARDASDAAHRNGVTISQLHQTQISGCRAGNQTRAQEIALWNHLASVSTPAPGETPKEIAANRKAVAAFLAYVARVFRPRDCATLYSLGR